MAPEGYPWSGGKGVLRLTPMAQLTEARNPDDDWTGLKDAAERRKRQNRLNVRAYRRRKALAEAAKTNAGVDTAAASFQHKARHDVASNAGHNLGPFMPPHRAILSHGSGHEGTGGGHDLPRASLDPSAKRLFPLSRDHLLPLVRYNVLRAVFTNVVLLAAAQELPLIHGGGLGVGYGSIQQPTQPVVCDDVLGVISRFSSPYEAGALPATLAPTALQRANPAHGFWIATIPHPRMRDNILRLALQGLMDPVDLCVDVCGPEIVYEHASKLRIALKHERMVAAMMGTAPAARATTIYDESSESDSPDVVEGGIGPQHRSRGVEMTAAEDTEMSNGVIAWTDPWRPEGWELGEGFVKKWKCILEGCPEMIAATNRWRALRGEEPLVVEV